MEAYKVLLNVLVKENRKDQCIIDLVTTSLYVWLVSCNDNAGITHKYVD